MAKAFEDMGVCAELLRVVEEHDWLVPTPIQAEVIPLLLGGGDVLAAAETGSGKTGAFMLPILQVIQETLLRPEAVEAPSGDGEPLDEGADHATDRIVWNRDDMDAQLRLADNGLCVSGLDTTRWLGARADAGVRSTGKYYYECEITRCGPNGIARVGWSTVAASLDLGMDRHGYGYGGTGKKAHAKQFTPYGEAFSEGDVIGCFLDLDAKTIWFSKNGVEFRENGFALTDTSKATTYFPAVCVKDAMITARFKEGVDGESSFARKSKAGAFGSISGSSTILRASGSTPPQLSLKGASRPIAVVLEPSRDLARQVFDCAVAFKKYMAAPPVRVSLCVGGGDGKSEKIPACDLVVATPGRLLDLFKQRKFDLSCVQLFVLDEVDQLIATDAVPIIEKIHSSILAIQTGVQIGFFSATLHAQGVQELALKLCRHPLVVDLKGKDFIPETVHHAMVSLTPADMRQRLVHLSDAAAAPQTDAVHTDSVKKLKEKLLDPATLPALVKDKEQLSLLVKIVKPMLLVEMLETLAIEQCMVFCRTNLDCDLLEKYLTRVGGGRGFSSGKENPLSCCVLAGMRSMASRQQALDAFKQGEIRVLICTDVAARGIDIPQLACVVNMTLPDTEENYIHRVGRVGRNGHLGLAVSLIAGPGICEKVWFHQRNCKKPRGVGCENRRLLDKGGCTIWYDESLLRSGVEKRLGEHVETVASVNELKAVIDKRGGMMQYGREVSKEDGKDPQSSRQELLQLAPHLKTLATLEDKVQIAWLELQQHLMVV